MYWYGGYDVSFLKVLWDHDLRPDRLVALFPEGS